MQSKSPSSTPVRGFGRGRGLEKVDTGLAANMVNDNQTPESAIIAENILIQMGNNRFRAMTGAKNFTVLHHGLRFNLPGYKVNTVTISLNDKDLYNVVCLKVGKSVSTSKIIGERLDVYAEDLQKAFKELTGLDTHL